MSHLSRESQFDPALNDYHLLKKQITVGSTHSSLRQKNKVHDLPSLRENSPTYALVRRMDRLQIYYTQ
jgi:hypothetical protein